MTREGRQKELVPTRTMSRAAVWDLAGAEGFQSPRSCHPGGAHDIATQVASARSAFETRRAKLFSLDVCRGIVANFSGPCIFSRAEREGCLVCELQPKPLASLTRSGGDFFCSSYNETPGPCPRAEHSQSCSLLSRGARAMFSRTTPKRPSPALARSASDFCELQRPVLFSRAERERFLRSTATSGRFSGAERERSPPP